MSEIGRNVECSTPMPEGEWTKARLMSAKTAVYQCLVSGSSGGRPSYKCALETAWNLDLDDAAVVNR